eukprot:TRINITY_DN44109_c0_g1_i1.p1 TRINITY_DN44109_c0_g1~~TRINITY_DN44109_c0_g1_i1.p1  ORF type:complete len:512 (-),score=83.84 TRINITY_DN44109_c0_g1_i1:610-2058(-)
MGRRPMHPSHGAVHTQRRVVGIIAILILGLFALVLISPGSFPVGTNKYPLTRHAVVLDAGSTGSRVHVYRFSVSSADAPLTLEHETFEELKPGLSFYKDNPQSAANSLSPLLRTAVDEVPKADHACTPIVLYATAGLRLLGPTASEAILDVVRQTISATGLTLPSVADVSVMDGTKEALYGWMTVNFLLHNWPAAPSGTGHRGADGLSAAIMDLGGASTQIVFQPQSPTALVDAPADCGCTTSVPRTSSGATGAHTHGMDAGVGGGADAMVLYQRSFLAYGLMKAGERMRKALKAAGRGNADGVCTSWSECVDAAATVVLGADTLEGGSIADGGGKAVARAEARRLSAARCQHNGACAVGGEYMPDFTRHFLQHGGRVYAFSYVYDRLNDFLPAVEQKHTTVGGIAAIGRDRVCGDAAYETKVSGGRMQHCQDVAYIYSLLRDGYGMSETTEVVVAKKIGGVETAWCLGAAIATTATFHRCA